MSKKSKTMAENAAENNEVAEASELDKAVAETTAEKTEKKKKEKTGKRGAVSHIFWILVLAVIVFGGYKLAPYVMDVYGIAQENKEISFEISMVDDDNSISQNLRKEGIVLSARAYRNFVARSQKIGYVPGVYKLNKNLSYKELIKVFTSEPLVDRSVVKVTFPEGYTVVDIASLLEENEICSAADFIKSQNEDNFDYDFVKNLKNVEKRGYRLEGYLFPATYDFQKNSQAKDVVNQMLAAFDERITSDVKSRLAELDMSLDEIITMASIIQKEAYGTETIKNIASVFWNRLKSDEFPYIQSDPTSVYAKSLGIAKSSFYDTYEYTGLPIGPICNPGFDMIDGALHPNNTTYFYFVTDSNNNFLFASDYETHEQNCYAVGLY